MIEPESNNYFNSISLGVRQCQKYRLDSLEVQQNCLHSSAELPERTGQLASKVDINMLRGYKLTKTLGCHPLRWKGTCPESTSCNPSVKTDCCAERTPYAFLASKPTYSKDYSCDFIGSQSSAVWAKENHGSSLQPLPVFSRHLAETPSHLLAFMIESSHLEPAYEYCCPTLPRSCNDFYNYAAHILILTIPPFSSSCRSFE